MHCLVWRSRPFLKYTSHTTTMNKGGGGAKGGEYGIFKTKSYLLLDGLFNDCKYMSLPCVIKQSCDDKEDWIRCHHCADMNTSARSCANRNAKAD